MYEKIYVPVDNSDHSDAAIEIAVALAGATGARVIGCHVYAARMHDVRFRQMEYTLPDEYRDEQELERQRKIHDSLITRGLQLISDCYLDKLGRIAAQAGVSTDYKTFDGKNWECLVKDIHDSDYDLIVMGALGMGAVKDSQLGSVAERVARRVRTDILVVRDPCCMRTTAPDRIVVGIDGSPQAFAGLGAAIELGRVFRKRVEAVAVYDPYLHYCMFNGIVEVLNAEASRVFRFQEQEQLHEEIIDSGLAQIYQSHLRVAAGLAAEEGIELRTTLLDGKAFKKILQHLRDDPPWLYVGGRIGVHSAPDMDLGSTTDNLLRLAPCNVLLSSRSHVPPVDVRAEASLTWTEEALTRMTAVPAHVQGVVRTAISRFALERGHSVISSSVFAAAVREIMPERAAALGVEGEVLPRAASMAEAAANETWICRGCGRPASFTGQPATCVVCGSTDFQRLDKADLDGSLAAGGVEEEAAFDGFRVRWAAEAKKVLERVPRGYERRRVKARIEKLARTHRLAVIGAEFAEANLDDAYLPVAEVVGGQEIAPMWTDEANRRLEQVPDGFMRTLARTKVEDFARRIGAPRITLDVVEGGLADARETMAQALEAYGPGAGEAARRVPGHGRVPTAPGVERPSPGWTEDGIRRLNEIEIRAASRFDPAWAREMARHAAESRAARTGEAINAVFLERLGLKLGYGHPLSERTFQHRFTWTPEAEARLAQVPEFCRELTRWRVEWMAFKRGLGDVITPAVMEAKYESWASVSQGIEAHGPEMGWDERAQRRLARVPDAVRGAVIQAVEGRAREMGETMITSAVLDRVIEHWIATGDFHAGRYGFRARS
jgi:nucleotide-binding universal stress UspA family protein/ribosomal protein L37E